MAASLPAAAAALLLLLDVARLVGVSFAVAVAAVAIDSELAALSRKRDNMLGGLGAAVAAAAAPDPAHAPNNEWPSTKGRK